jgi:hypothetical protein
MSPRVKFPFRAKNLLATRRLTYRAIQSVGARIRAERNARSIEATLRSCKRDAGQGTRVAALTSAP